MKAKFNGSSLPHSTFPKFHLFCFVSQTNSETALAETENIPTILSSRISHAYIWIASPVIVHKYFDICKKFLDKQHKICYHIIGKTLTMIDQGFNIWFHTLS